MTIGLLVVVHILWAAHFILPPLAVGGTIVTMMMMMIISVALVASTTEPGKDFLSMNGIFVKVNNPTPVFIQLEKISAFSCVVTGSSYAQFLFSVIP